MCPHYMQYAVCSTALLSIHVTAGAHPYGCGKMHLCCNMGAASQVHGKVVSVRV